MKKLLIFSVLLMCFCACQKRKNLLEAVKNISGEYIWSYSSGLPKIETEEKHGVVIDDKGNLLLYNDTKCEEKYRINACEQLNDSLFKFSTIKKKNPNKPNIYGTVTITHTGLREMDLTNYPYVENYYYENN